ncbi:MAG TPA: KUP/HAK/KT family potassium transporter [Candidatus Baltobacteraceae bacterium]
MDKHRAAPSALALGALGVVFGDIGTSPLYAFKLCFAGQFPAALTPANILGIVSLILWSLVVVVCVKYVTFMLRADNDGQGGTIALLALLSPRKRTALPLALSGLALMVLLGECMLYGDGAITPAISVISALEGLDVWTTAAHPYIVPASIVVLLALFFMQRRGTDRIGKFFGPVMVLWFAVLAIAGIHGIAENPKILAAISPLYAVDFFLRNGLRSLLIFGAVVLCVTGVEALYSDLAHFGRKPITLAWYAVVFPALIVNYLGQGAITLLDPRAPSPFFALVPRWGVVPMVLLATVATVIASQALISGVFSLTQQLMQLGFAPRFRIVHTSRAHSGQIYIPAINTMLAIVCIALVLAFRSSEAFGGAYGLAVTITMLVSSLAFFELLRRRWNWPIWGAVALVGLFLLWDVPFLAGNLSKVMSGGWVPLLMAGVLFVLFSTWNRGRRRLMTDLTPQTMSVADFLTQTQNDAAHVRGTAFFLTPDADGIPYALQHTWLRNHIVFDTVVLLTVLNANQPFVHPDQRIEVEELAPRLLRVRAWYGFMQEPSIHDILRHLRNTRPNANFREPSYYLASPKIRPDYSKTGLPAWQRMLFLWMTRNARPLTDSLGLPPNSIIEFGVEVQI